VGVVAFDDRVHVYAYVAAWFEYFYDCHLVYFFQFIGEGTVKEFANCSGGCLFCHGLARFDFNMALMFFGATFTVTIKVWFLAW